METFYKIGSFSNNPLSLPGWVKWNEQKWNVKAEHLVYKKNGSEFPKLEGIVYRDNKGRVVMPKLNPYLPFEFTDSTLKHYKLYNDYQDVMMLFINDLEKFGISKGFALPPGFMDARPFQWRNYMVDMSYTFVQDMNSFYDSAKHIRKNINKAVQNGYTVENSRDWNAIMYCLSGTETVKSFKHHLSVSDMQNCEDLLGCDVFRGYLVHDKLGQPAAGGIRLVMKDGITIDWVEGAVFEHLKYGVNQLIYQYVLNDSQKAGALYFDWCGANISAVALAKSAWGVPVRPYFMIMEKSLKNVLYVYLKPRVKKILGKT